MARPRPQRPAGRWPGRPAASRRRRSPAPALAAHRAGVCAGRQGHRRETGDCQRAQSDEI